MHISRFGALPRRPAPASPVRSWLLGGVVALATSGLSAQDEDPAPNFDLAIDSPESVRGDTGASVPFDASVLLRTSDNPSDDGAQGWSLSIASTGALRFIDATTDGTAGAETPSGLRDSGFENTELTTGTENEGLVSAVVLSFQMPVELPPEGESTLLAISGEIDVPDDGGCAEGGLVFRDGLQGAGQPVSNRVTWQGKTRKDDGGEEVNVDEEPFDNDSDGPEHGRIFACVPDASGFVRGDCDSNELVNLTDAVFELNHLFLGGPRPVCRKACDTDDNGALNVTDAIRLLNYLFLAGPEPVAPFPECGEDPTDDDLSCVPQPACAG